MIHVEDTIYFVTSIDGVPEIGFTVRLNDGRALELEASTLHYKPGRLTCKVTHPNDKTREEARFLSTAYHELLKHIESDPKGFHIIIEGKKIIFEA